LDVKHALVLETVVLREEVILSAPGRRRVLGIVVERVETLGQLRAIRNLVEIRKGHLVLGLDPRCCVRGRVVFQPSIRVGDRRAVIGIDVIDGVGRGVLNALCGQGRRQGEQDEQGDLLHSDEFYKVPRFQSSTVPWPEFHGSMVWCAGSSKRPAVHGNMEPNRTMPLEPSGTLGTLGTPGTSGARGAYTPVKAWAGG